MDRRQFVIAGSAAALLASRTAAAESAVGQEATPQAADARLNALFDRIFAAGIDRSPESATSLGLDKGARAYAKRRLSDRTLAETQRTAAQTQGFLRELDAINEAQLSAPARLNREIVRYQLQSQLVGPTRFRLAAAGQPYRIHQMGGAYYSVPDFLNDTHSIANAADAEAYLARLDAFATALDQEGDAQRTEAARGYLAPGFALDLALAQMARLRAVPAAEASLVQSLVRRARAAQVAGEWQTRAAQIVERRVYPALDRQIALMRTLRPTARAGDGVWRVPDGEAIYAAALEASTTTRFTPDEVHRMGLEQVAAISAQLDTILRAQGLTQGNVGTRLAALNVRPDQIYPDTPEGRAALIASLNADTARMQTVLAGAFTRVPDAPLDIRAVPVEVQDGAANGYYKRAALDGSRPAIYYVNLKEVSDWPKYGLTALTYHEGLPGHHLQITLAQQSRDIPMLRKVGGFGAYTEGWALYAEQLADELGAFRTPLERAGYLQSFLFRAARLVVDTGIHTKRWSREQAARYMVDTTGFPEPRSLREVERYCVWPGQACSYKVGHMAWARARAAAEKAMGPRFDLKRFHDVLNEGAMPLTVLERLLAERMRT